MNCGTCKFWNLVGALGEQGFGQCDARTDREHRMAITTSAQAMCRIGKFAKAEPKIIRSREKQIGAIL